MGTGYILGIPRFHLYVVHRRYLYMSTVSRLFRTPGVRGDSPSHKRVVREYNVMVKHNHRVEYCDLNANEWRTAH